MLNLGDSYTIGEGVPAEDNFPHLLQQQFQHAGIPFGKPEIIATTGHTTAELQQAIAHRAPQGTYDLVTLLCGVNNQYRGQLLSIFETEFEALLQQAIAFAGNASERVVVLSIPDWGSTPFALKDRRTPLQIGMEISRFNKVCKKLSQQYRTGYVDVFPWSQQFGSNPEYLNDDQLHYSKKMYALWATGVFQHFMKPTP